MKGILAYRKIIWVFILLLIFTGIFTYFQLPKRDIPEISQNLATISTPFPGASPEEVERTVVNPLESTLLDMEGVDQVTSASTTGFSILTIILENSADFSSAEVQIRQAVADEAQSFPDEVLESEVDTNVMASNVATYHVMADNREELYQLRSQIETWKEQLSFLSGVQSLLIKGLPEEVVSISLDNEEIKQQQMNPSEIITAIDAELAPSAIGEQQQSGTIYQLTLDKYQQLEELSNIPVGTGPNDNPVYLGDIASIQLENEEAADLITYKDQPAISVTVQAEEGVNISGLQDQLTEQVDLLSGELPENVSVERFYAQSTVIDEVFTNLISSFAISFFAVLVVMFLGLPFASAIIVALAIPISILIGLIPLPYAGVDLNQISIIGMIVAIGILVDDAIVVNDNIQRRYQLGDAPLIGAVNGAKEVRVSIITSTLMIVFSFLPLTFLSGSNGDFIRALPTVLILTVLASTLLAFLFIPTLQFSGRQKKRGKKKSKIGLLGGVFNKIESGYADTILPMTTKRPWLVAISGIIACLLLILLIFRVPFEFFPDADRAEVTLSARYEQGTPIEETNENIREIEAFLYEENPEDITETAIYTGSGLPGIFSSSMSRTGENTGQLAIRVDRSSTSASAFIDEWQTVLRERNPDAEIFLETIVSGPPPSPPVELRIQGEELDGLLDVSQRAADELSETEGAELVTMNTGSSQPYIRYNPDREQLAEQGISIEAVTRTLQLANTGAPLGQLDNGEERIPLTVILDEGNPDGIALENLEIAGGIAPGNPAELMNPPEVLSFDTFISTEQDEQLGAIPHRNGERTITLEAYAASGKEDTFTEAAAQTVTEIEDNLPPGYSLNQTGESDERSEFFIEVSKLFVIVLFLIYLTIAIQFNSLLMPLLITGTVFLAVTGAIVGLFVSGEPLSFLAVLGIVSLSGIVVRNSIIMVEFIEQNKQTYSSVIEAVTEAGRARIRPIILTSVTSIAALTPIIFTGDVLFKPLAVSIVFGLIFSTILTLLLLPSFYLILEKIRR